MTTMKTPALDADEILARILSSDPTFDYPPSDQSFSVESGFIDDDLYDTTHLIHQPNHLIKDSVNQIDHESPEDNNEFVGIGAKKKTFRIPIENFTEYHAGATGYQRLPRGKKSHHRKDRRQYGKSDSVEKLDTQDLLAEEKIANFASTPVKSDTTRAQNSSFRSPGSENGLDKKSPVKISPDNRHSSGSTISSNSSDSTPVKPKRNSVHYASTSIVSIPSPSKSIEIHRTNKQDTSQALHSLRKRVQIVQDESNLKLLPYTIPRDCTTRVTFPAATWDLMMQNFRIALSMDNVFICDHFLGREVAIHLLQELEMLKRSGHFERHMQRSNNPGATNYSCVFLTEPDESVPRLDGLVLMVYKLARYFTSDWKQTSVQITYYPDGHTLDSIQKQGTNRKLLKCVYFANQTEDPNHRRRSTDSGSSEESQRNTGRYFIDANNSEMKVEAKFDRLVAFWGDSISHRIEACSAERYIINVWMVR